MRKKRTWESENPKNEEHEEKLDEEKNQRKSWRWEKILTPHKPLLNPSSIKNSNCLWAAHVPSKNSFGPQFGDFMDNQKLGTKVKTEVQNGGEMGMTFRITLIPIHQYIHSPQWLGNSSWKMSNASFMRNYQSTAH
jgi:hypothetical protein